MTTQFPGRLDRDQDTIERKRLVVDVGIAFQAGVDRDQIVGAIDLNAVAGIIDHSDIGIAGAIGKIAQRAAGFGGGNIATEIDHIEACILQRRCHHRAVVHRIGEGCDILVGGIADHQRDALLGKGRLARQHHQQRRQDKLIKSKRSRRFQHRALRNPCISSTLNDLSEAEANFGEPDH